MKKFVFGYVVFTIFITAALFYPYSVHMTDSLPNAIDPVFYAWNLMHNYQSALHGFKDLLNTNIFYPEGNTLALSDTLYAQTVLTAPIIALTGSPVLAENLYVLATFPLAALAMFLLCYRFTRSPVPSAAAGIFYAFSFPRIAQIGHMPALSSQWLPLVFLSLTNWVHGQKIRDLFFLYFWYLASITSTMYFGVFLIPMSLIVVAFQLRHTIGRLIRQFLIILVPASIILVIVLFPYIRLRAEYPGIRRSLDDAVRLSAAPRDYLTVLPTSWLSDVGLPADTNERTLFPTITLLVLAVVSLMVTEAKYRKTVFGFFLVAAAAFVLSLGPRIGSVTLPYYYLYKIFPLLESIRVPARFSIFVILGLSVCASFTLKKILHMLNGYGAMAILVLLFFTEVWQVGTPSVQVPTRSTLPPAYEFLARAPTDSIIAELPLHPEWKGIRMEDQLTLTYREANENDVYALEAYRTYFSAFHGLRMLNGYSGYFPNVYHDHSILLDSFPSPQSVVMLEKERVRYILVHTGEYTGTRSAELISGIKGFPQVKPVVQFGTDYIFSL